ncbi:armadillo repeat-containing protein 2 [Diorhabda carinulata]|uniref:armadillo repeat-containing protein 2 n=1 Tax=Diorhabda carinulata TaxID=1163345 RepID=UPI0025A1C73E|nr:armadillo repeat-containing protein 2 [Diorhabda carinulata]
MEWKIGRNEKDIMKFQGSSKVSSPFYEPPQRKTSAEIINEARVAIRESQMAEKNFAQPSIKPLQTERPYTPRDKERLLFGNKIKSNRPPSSFSLQYLQNETDLPTTPPDSTSLLTPNLITSRTLITPPKNPNKVVNHMRSNSVSEINDQIFNIAVKDSLHKIKLPSLDNCKPLPKRKIFKNTSLDNLPEENEYQTESQKNEGRKAFSSPQERTDSNDSDRVFGKPSLHKRNLSQCLLLGPQNLEKIFDNKQIIENSQTLFLNTGYFTSQLHNSNYLKVDNKKEKTFEDVLLELNSENEKKCGEERIIKLLGELYDCMDMENMINQKVASNTKIRILKCLYRFVESRNEHILISIAKIILAIKVTGNNLSGVCKLIFKVAKIDKNDHLFFQKNLLELFLDALGRSSPLDDAEACVYGYGAVKFLTMNQKLLEKILSLGILQLMVLHMKIINVTKEEKSVIPDQSHHALYQLTGALRNLVSEERMYDSFIECGTIPQLCLTLEIFASDLDIVANISRTMSIISTNECCCDVIIEYRNIYKVLINLFDKYPGNEEIIIRLTYTLGNIVSKIDNTRVQFFHEENSIESLVNLWKIYLERTLKNCSMKLDTSDELNSNSEDVMIKIIRVIANMVINPEIGRQLNEKYGNQLIEEILKVLISNPFKKNEDLVLSILSTLNNLSYYYTSDLEADIFHIKQVDIVEAITEYAKSRNKDCVIETMRILGNLSRSKITRKYITESEVFGILIELLDSGARSQLKTTVGVFVNLMSDNRSRTLFKDSGGVAKLIKILSTECGNDWSLENLICQVLWNYCIDIVDLHELFSDSEIHKLLVLLADHLDEEKIFGIEEHTEDMNVFVTQDYLIWEEFANVATNLLEKIEFFLDTFDQITHVDKSPVENLKTKDSSTNISLSAW